MNALPGFDRWLERPYTDAVDAQMREEAAIEEYWDECAAEYAADQYNYILDREDMAELVQRVARLSRVRVTDETMRGLGEELLEIARAYQAMNEDAINAMCIKRAQRNRGDW